MSDDGPEWFAPKRYGYGSGLPISWQGWAITIAFVAIVGRRSRSCSRTGRSSLFAAHRSRSTVAS